MNRFLIIIGLLILSNVAYTQDFASRFKSEYEGDSALVYVTISPKMMHDILGSAEINDEMVEVIAQLKSMQMCISLTEGQNYFDSAIDLCERNTNLFEPYLSYDEAGDNCKIMVRKRRDEIIELVMFMKQDNGFALINFTGKMNAAFISRLAESMNTEKSS